MPTSVPNARLSDQALDCRAPNDAWKVPMPLLLRIALTRRIFKTAMPVCLVVGTVLNLVNQGGAIFSGAGISWFHLVLNYVVPYCVSSYSAARVEATKEQPQ